MRIDNIDPLSKNAITPPRKTQAAPSLTPQQVQRLSEIKTRAGWVPPDQQLLLAKSGATDDAVDAVGNLNAKQIVEAQVEEEKGSWLRRNVYDPLKAATRWGTAGLNFVPEFVQGGIAQVFDEGTDIDGWFISTELGSMIENPELRGEGFFPGAKLKEKQGERARRYRGTVNGSAWTVGRGAANLVFKENTKPYTVMSGILDALVAIKVDPTKPVTGAIKFATKGRYTVPLLSDVATASIREALENEAGVVKGLADISLDGTKFDTFSRTNGRMMALIDRVTKEKDALKIAEDIFDHKLPNELSVALAAADDPEDVRKLLGAGWTLRKGALPTDVRDVQKGLLVRNGIGNFIVEKVPLIDGIRKSRFFTRMETGAVNMLGDQRSNTQAVKSIVSYLRTAGVDQETVSEIGNMALKSFTPGASDVARRKTLDTFTSTLRSVMKTDGIPQESIDELFARGGDTLTKVRTYLIDRTGTAADNGYSSFLLNKNRDYLPSEEIETLLKDLGAREGDKLTIVSPTELVEMLDRTVVLPDLREIRRFTRNPIFRNLIGDEFGKLPITAKRQLRKVEVITDQKEYDRLGEEIRTLVVKRNKTSADFDKLDSLYKQRNDLKILETRKVITPEQRASVAVLDLMQNELWKPLALATGGYIVRNSLDAQFRMAMSDLPSLFSHPFEYINLVLGTSKKMTLRLENIADVRRPFKPGQVPEEDVVTVDDLVDDVREAMTFGLRQQGLGPIDIERHMAQTGVFPIVDRATNGLAMHTDAIIQQGRRSTNDVLRKVANQTFVEYGGISTPSRDAAVERIVNVIMSNKKIRKQIDDMHEYGFQIVNDATGKTTRMPAIKIRELPEDEIKATYRQYAYRIVVDNQQYMTGGIPEMNFMYAFGYTPITEKGRMVGAFDALAEDVVSLEPDDAIKVGAVVQLGDNKIGVITKLRDAATDEMVIDPFDGSVVPIEGRTATIQPVELNRSFDSLKGSYEARQLIGRMPVTDAPGVPGLPAKTKLELMETVGYRNDKYANIKSTMDTGADWFFGRLYGTVTRRLERSPVFREYYYRTVLDYVDRLQPSDAQRFLDDVAEKAKEAGVSVQKYVGSKDLIAAMKKSASTPIATGPKVLNPTLVAESGTLFHGTATQVAGKKFGDIFSVVAEDANNLFGRGLYLTDSPNVAISYTAKGAATRTKIGNIPVNPEGFVYRVKPSATAKLIDLRQSSQEVNRIVGSFLDDQLESLLEYATEDEFAAIRGLLANPETTGEMVISAFRKLFRGETQEIADIYMQEITVALRDVADGLIYKGGVRRGGLGEHTAYVFLNENAVEIVDEVRPTVAAAARGKDITLEDLDDYAKFSALNSTKELLYDASERTNLEDVARIIMPFAPAWKEILGTYIGFLKSNPVNTARSFQRIYTGMTGADPDNDGRGFFYNDPQTGQMMFTFPGSGTLAKALTGLDATLEAPTKRLSQGIQAFPALGPMAQVAASKILPHLPASDELTGIFLPYGPKELGSAFNPTPGWLIKAQQVLTAPETDKETVYANTYIETFRALSATGDYDLDSKEDVAQLESDARFKARILTAFRALSQFFGPTAGATEFKVPTDQGDQFVGELIKAFYDYQADPSIGYDGAVPKFLETFGDEAALYVASKSKAIADGLEATQEYQDWADKNGSLIRDYENTARYLAPAGSDFNFSVWSLQLQAGERVQLSAKEILELAQRRVGSAKYREARLTVGPYPSEDARAALKAYRAYLHDKYPGFPANAEFEVGAYYNDVLELKELVSDKRAVDNPTAQSIREYLVARDEAIARSGVSEQGFKTAKKALRFRMQLESFGVALAEQNANFARIWDRLLASEVE